MMAHLVAYDQGFEDGRLLIIYCPIYDHGGGAYGQTLKSTLKNVWERQNKNKYIAAPKQVGSIKMLMFNLKFLNCWVGSKLKYLNNYRLAPKLWWKFSININSNIHFWNEKFGWNALRFWVSTEVSSLAWMRQTRWLRKIRGSCSEVFHNCWL